MKKFLILACLFSVTIAVEAQPLTLQYAHMNAPDSVAGVQAAMFAELVAEKTGGAVTVEVYPSSQLGSIQQMAEQVQVGIVAFHHNTMAGIGSLYSPLSALDTPFLYRDVEHLIKVGNPSSNVMRTLNAEMIEASGLRILYTFYFGTRHLTANKAVRSPADLEGVRIRAIPFPIYITAIEGLGAIATPVDWAEVPKALEVGLVSGQENPLDVIYTNKLYDLQSHLMMTGHIRGMECVVVNESVWKSLSSELQSQILAAAQETSQKATEMVLEREANTLEKLKSAGMTVIGPEDGLDLEAFRAGTNELVSERFGEQYGDLYQAIRRIQ